LEDLKKGIVFAAAEELTLDALQISVGLLCSASASPTARPSTAIPQPSTTWQTVSNRSREVLLLL